MRKSLLAALPTDGETLGRAGAATLRPFLVTIRWRALQSTGGRCPGRYNLSLEPENAGMQG